MSRGTKKKAIELRGQPNFTGHHGLNAVFSVKASTRCGKIEVNKREADALSEGASQSIHHSEKLGNSICVSLFVHYIRDPMTRILMPQVRT